MNDDAARSETATLRGLGGKIGIAALATPDFDLVYANALAVEKFCDQYWGRIGMDIDLRVAPMMQRLKSSRES